MKVSDLVVAAAGEFAPLNARLEDIEKELGEVTTKYGESSDDGEQEALLETMEKLSAEKKDLMPKVEKAKRKLDVLREREKSMVGKATPAKHAPNIMPNGMKKDPSQDYKPGDFFIRSMLVKAVAHLAQRPEAEVFQERYGSDDTTRAAWERMSKAAVPVADTTTNTWASELVRNDIRGFLEMIKNTSVGAAIASRSLQLEFDGYGSITIPRMNQIDPTAQTEPAWVGEGGHIPLQRFSFGSAVINRFKLASIVPMTMELVEQATPAAEGVMRAGMEEAYALMLDKAILSNAAAVAGIRPAGLLNGLTGNATGTGDATGGYQSVVNDMKAMLGYLASQGLGQRPVLILNDQDFVSVGMLMNQMGQMMFRDEVSGGRLLGVEVVHSRNAPAGTAIMVDAAALATAFDVPQFKISQEATLVMLDSAATAPTHAADAAGALHGTAGEVPPDGGIPVARQAGLGAAGAGSSAVNMFQTFSEAIRGIWPTSWAQIRPNNVVERTAIKWS